MGARPQQKSRKPGSSVASLMNKEKIEWQAMIGLPSEWMTI
jgi:hypothetical protein